MIINIAVFGAFDVNSYGDSLFPKALKIELSKRMNLGSMIFFSPTTNKSDYTENGNEFYTYDQFEEMHEKYQFNALIIGGGELLHNKDICFCNSLGENICYNKGDIWRKPLEYAQKYSIKVLFNSVGAPDTLTREDYALLARADYISVRDPYSLMHICGNKNNTAVKLVPDSLWNLDEYYTEILDKNRDKANKVIGLNNSEAYIAFQLGTMDQWDSVYKTVSNYAKEKHYQLVVFAINVCHEDIQTVEEIAKKYKTECITINRMLKPQEIMRVISCAELFVGTSLHGALTACLSGTKVVIYNMYSGFVSKMDGFAEEISLTDYLAESPYELEHILRGKNDNKEKKGSVNNLKENLKNHFDKMSHVIQDDIETAKQSETNIVGLNLIRSYFEWKNEQGEWRHKTVISVETEGKFIVNKPFDTGTDATWHLPLNGVAKIVIADQNSIMEPENVEKGGYCFEREAIYKVRNFNTTLEFEVKLENGDIQAREKGLWQKARNQEGHIELLLDKERNLTAEMQKQQEYIELLLTKERNLTEKIQQLMLEHDNSIQENDKLMQENNNLVQKNDDLMQENNKLKQENNELLEVKNEYDREKKSRTYRMALNLRKISAFFLPPNSKRRFLARMLLKGIRHPRLMLKMINMRRIRNFIQISKTEGMDAVNKHYEEVEKYERNKLNPFHPEQFEITAVDEELHKKITDYEKLEFIEWDTPEVSIIIPVYNQFDYTYNCLCTILKNSGKVTYEILIADDCSTDYTKDLEQVVSGIHVLHNEKNLRFLLNCNNAAKYAKGKYIVFLNNDTQVQNNWLQPLMDILEKDATVGMTGSKLVYADGYLQEAGGILWKDGSAWNYGNRQNPDDAEFNYVREVDYISGAAIMIRHTLWKEIGGFDETFVPAYCEDSDLAFEVRKHGYKVVYQPTSQVIHFEGISNGTDLSSGQKKYQVENQKKFLQKWQKQLEKDNFENGTNVFLARERSRNKKHVLVIDHYVPQYDKDAGSKTTFMYLKMLVQKGYQVTFLGDNFYPHQPYTEVLQQMGIFVLYGPKYSEHCREWLLENIKYFDVIYLNRPHITIKYIDLIKENARGRIIYYGHDLHFLRIHREYELNNDKKLLAESEKWKEQELYIMHKADMNYYPSEVECTEIHKIDSTIPVKAITAYVYNDFRNIQYIPDQREGLLFVGGFGHAPNLDAVKWFLDKIYPEVYRQTKASFYIVGSNAPEEITNLNIDGVIVKGFVTEEELQKLYNSCRIAVVPLRYGAGVKGKVVEALYYGIPIVTTSVGAEGIQNVENCVAVENGETALIQTICSLYNDLGKLQNMSETSQEYVKDHFSVDAAWSVIEKDFN